MRYFILLLALLPMVSCSSPEERAEREAQTEIAACTKAGYQPDTPAFDNCRLQVKAQADQRAADRVAAGQQLQPNLPGLGPTGYSIPLR